MKAEPGRSRWPATARQPARAYACPVSAEFTASPSPLYSYEYLSQQPRLTPSEQCLSASAANPTLHSAQLASVHVLASRPITAGDVVPVLVAQERVGSVSQAADAAAGWLTRITVLSLLRAR